MAYKIQNRNDTAANWTSANPTLAQGEIGLETDTRKFKVGTGSAAWNSLAYGVATGPYAAADFVQAISDKSASYTITAADRNTTIRSTGAAITITIANVLAVGESVQFIQYGAGQITFTFGAGVTLNSADSLMKTAKLYAAATVLCVASGVYVLIGNLG